jgi:hypothetical protein
LLVRRHSSTYALRSNVFLQVGLDAWLRHVLMAARQAMSSMSCTFDDFRRPSDPSFFSKYRPRPVRSSHSRSSSYAMSSPAINTLMNRKFHSADSHGLEILLKAEATDLDGRDVQEQRKWLCETDPKNCWIDIYMPRSGSVQPDDPSSLPASTEDSDIECASFPLFGRDEADSTIQISGKM